MTEVGSVLYVPVEANDMVASGSCRNPSCFSRGQDRGSRRRRGFPIGAAGELWVSGPDILQGYYKRPEATADAFAGKWFVPETCSDAIRAASLYARQDQGRHPTQRREHLSRGDRGRRAGTPGGP